MRRKIKLKMREEQDLQGGQRAWNGAALNRRGALNRRATFSTNPARNLVVKPGKQGFHWSLNSRVCCSFFSISSTVIVTIAASPVVKRQTARSTWQ